MVSFKGLLIDGEHRNIKEQDISCRFVELSENFPGCMNILGIFRRGRCCASHVKKKIVLQHGLYCIIEHFINWRCTKHGCLAIKYF